MNARTRDSQLHARPAFWRELAPGDHACHVYKDDNGLLDTLCGFVGGGREVRAFGEMVALLWARGHYAATVRLEHLWNKALERERIRLVCGYPRDGFKRGRPESIRQVDASHCLVARY